MFTEVSLVNNSANTTGCQKFGVKEQSSLSCPTLHGSTRKKGTVNFTIGCALVSKAYREIEKDRGERKREAESKKQQKNEQETCQKRTNVHQIAAKQNKIQERKSLQSLYSWQQFIASNPWLVTDSSLSVVLCWAPDFWMDRLQKLRH